jgi:Na+-transporting methylmalonyl-CoA/oxaloacetate decarboxylase gamma subunit
MKYLIKIKELAIEYWEIFVAFLFLLIGVVWGTSGSREKVLKDDARAKEKARIKQQKETVNAVAKKPRSSKQRRKR